MSKTTYYIIATACILVCIGVIAGSIQLGFYRAVTGQDTLVWLHAGAFLVVIGLILAVIIVRAKVQE